MRADCELEVTAWPAAVTSRPMPSMVLQAEVARAAAMTPRARSLRMGDPIIDLRLLVDRGDPWSSHGAIC